MKYINATPNDSGAYPGPQGTPFSGSISLTDEQSAQLVAYNGFVTLTVADGTVTAVTPNTEAWEAWKASLPAETDPEPTTVEKISALETENKLLAAQVSALTDQNDFKEELIVELAGVVYA